MSLRIQNNVEALGAHRNLQASTAAIASSMERLSSGYRINRAADDAAGLAVSERMRAQARGLSQAMRNAEDGISLVQTAEGALHEVHAMLHRVRELAVQHASGHLSEDNRDAIRDEVAGLAEEVARVTDGAQFNGRPLFQAAGTITFQVGANDGETVVVETSDLSAAIGTAPFSLTDDPATVLAELDGAIAVVSDRRAELGAVQNRLRHVVSGLGVYHENLTAAESRIRDVDMADEMVRLTKTQILQQSGTSMLAQANQAPQAVLRLLQG